MGAGKRVFWTFSVKEAEAFAGYLEHMAAQGWYLERIGQYSMKFCPGEPRRLRYAAAVVPGTSAWGDGDLGQIRSQQERCRAAGWEFCCRGAWWQIFSTEDPERPAPEELRPGRQLEIQRGILLSPFVTIATLILVGLFVWNICQILERPAVNLSKNVMLLLLLLELWLAVLAGWNLIASAVWYWRGRRALRQHRDWAGPAWKRIVFKRRLGTAGLIGAAAVLCVFYEWSAESPFIPLFSVLMAAVFSGLQGWLRRNGSSSGKKNFAAYVAISAVLVVLFTIVGSWSLFRIVGSRGDGEAPGYVRKGEFPVAFSQLGYEEDERSYHLSQRSLIAFYQRESGRGADGGGRLTMEYLESPVPAVIRLARDHYPDVKGNAWRMTETELPQEQDGISVVRCRFELVDPQGGVWTEDGFDCYLIWDDHRLLVLRYSETVEEDAIAPAVDAFFVRRPRQGGFRSIGNGGL